MQGTARGALPFWRRRWFGARPSRPARLAGQTIIFGVHAGGLGDHLAYSILPRLYRHAGAARVLVSSVTNNGEAFTRNPEIRDFVWAQNPFLDGFTDLPPNVGETSWPPRRFFDAARTAASPVDAVAAVHGLGAQLDHGTRRLPPRPDLFYRPRPRPDVADRIVCDPHSTSQPFAPEVFEAFVRHVLRGAGRTLDAAVVLTGPHAGVNGTAALPGVRRHAVRDLFEYADIVASAGCFLVTEAGGQSVAAAFRGRSTFVLTTTRAFNERCFLWPGNIYCVTGQMTPGAREWPD